MGTYNSVGCQIRLHKHNTFQNKGVVTNILPLNNKKTKNKILNKYNKKNPNAMKVAKRIFRIHNSRTEGQRIKGHIQRHKFKWQRQNLNLDMRTP